jgi:predicted nucleic acid-binding protein
VVDPPVVPVVERDSSDDMVWVAAEADYIVSRDKDLPSLGSYQGIRMVTPRQFLDLLDQGG